MARKRLTKKQQDEQAALAFIAIVISAGVGLLGLIAAAKRYEHHKTLGNAAKVVLAIFNLAEDVE